MYEFAVESRKMPIKNFANINKTDFVYKMFFVSTMILIVQLAFVYLSSGDMLSVIQNKQARIGIGEINLPATVLAIPPSGASSSNSPLEG